MPSCYAKTGIEIQVLHTASIDIGGAPITCEWEFWPPTSLFLVTSWLREVGVPFQNSLFALHIHHKGERPCQSGGGMCGCVKIPTLTPTQQMLGEAPPYCQVGDGNTVSPHDSRRVTGLVCFTVLWKPPSREGVVLCYSLVRVES